MAYDRRITGTLRYKTPRPLRRGRRNRITDKGKISFSLLSNLVFSFKVSSKSRLYSTKKTASVNADIATVNGRVDKG
jgi:hypothetical protein